MKVNDLRIGNLVEYEGEILRVGKIQDDDYCILFHTKKEYQEYNPEGSYAIGLTPISLTHEWLIRLGFEKIHEHKFTKNIFDVRFENRYTFFFVNLVCLSNIETTYVHNLQNAYYFNVGYKNGEELTLKNE